MILTTQLQLSLFKKTPEKLDLWWQVKTLVDLPVGFESRKTWMIIVKQLVLRS